MDHIDRTPNGAVGTDYVFSGNGIFDPNITGTGGQPVNFDDWAAIYGRYRVYGSKISVDFTNTGTTTSTGQMLFCLAPRHTTTAVTTLNAWLSAASNLYAKHTQFTSSSTTSRGTNPFISSRISVQDILGYKTSAIDDDDTLQALTSANPNHQFYWHLMTQMTDQTSSQTTYMTVRIEYDVEFFDRLDTLLDSVGGVRYGGDTSVPRLLRDPVKREPRSGSPVDSEFDKVESRDLQESEGREAKYRQITPGHRPDSASQRLDLGQRPENRRTSSKSSSSSWGGSDQHKVQERAVLA
jgi:hypothetical protein